MKNNIFDVVMNYISADISKIYDKLKTINLEISNIQEFLDSFLNHDSQYSFSEDIYDTLKMESSYDKFIESINILDRVDYNKLQNEPQIREILDYFSNVERNLYRVIDDKVKVYNDLKKEYLMKKNTYSQYIRLMSGQVDSLENEDIKNDFFDFLCNSSLDIKYVDYLINYLSNRKIINSTNGLENDVVPKKEDKNDVKEMIKEARKNEHKTPLPTLSLDLIDQIETYKEEFNSLNEKEQNSIISAVSLMMDGNEKYLENIAYGFTKNEILYYSSIFTLLNLYKSYNDYFNEKNLKEASNDEESYEMLSIYLEEIVDDITQRLKQITRREEDVMEEKTTDEIDSNNLVIFLNDEVVDKNGQIHESSVWNIDIDYIKKKAGGEADKTIKYIISLVNSRFRKMSSNKFRCLGPRLNKPITNLYNSHYNEFDDFKVRVAKWGYNNPARISYITISVSENNRKILSEKYNLPNDANVYLILGVFMKKNDDSEYVRITHNRLVRNHENVMKLEKIFERDFDDLTGLKAKKIIDKGLSIVEELSETYKNVNVK